MSDNIIFIIRCWITAFIFCMVFIMLMRNYIKYYKGDKLQLILLILEIFFIVLLLLLPILKIVLDYN